MHELLVNRLFKPAQEKVWLGKLTVHMTIAVDLGRKATKQTNKGPLKFFSRSALFWSIGFGFLKLFAPAAWSTHKGTFDSALLDWKRALDRRAEFAPFATTCR